MSRRGCGCDPLLVVLSAGELLRSEAANARWAASTSRSFCSWRRVMVLLLVVLLVVVSLVVLVPPVRPGVDVVGFLGGDLLSGERVGVLRVGERAEGKP